MTNQSNDFKDYLDNIKEEVKTNPIRSELLPTIVMGVMALFSWNEVGMLIALAVLFFRFQLFLKMRRGNAPDVKVVEIGRKKPDGASFFTSMLKGRYFAFMPKFMYTLLGLACMITSFSILGHSLFLIPVTIWMFNWARAFFKIGDKEKKARSVSYSYEQTPPQPQPKPADIPLPKTDAYKQVWQEKMAKANAAPGIDPFYQQAILAMQRDLNALDEKESSISGFLDDLFGDSEITKTKYMKPIRNAKAVVQKNLDKVKQAVKLFGGGTPSPERRNIIDNYVADANDIVAKVDIIIDELVKIDQGQLLKNNDVLDETLNELAATTHYYQQS